MDNHFSETGAADGSKAKSSHELMSSTGETHQENEALINRMVADMVSSTGQSTADKAAPDSALSRYGSLTIKGLEYAPQGLLHAGKEAISNPVQTLGIIGSSAVMGAVLKTVLPEAGPAGKIASLAIGAYFTYEAAQPVMQSYKAAANATSEREIDLAARQLGNAAGSFVVNSAIAGVGYGLGAYGANRVLMRPELQGYNAGKQAVWNEIGNEVGRITGFSPAPKISALPSEPNPASFKAPAPDSITAKPIEFDHLSASFEIPGSDARTISIPDIADAYSRDYARPMSKPGTDTGNGLSAIARAVGSDDRILPGDANTRPVNSAILPPGSEQANLNMTGAAQQTVSGVARPLESSAAAPSAPGEHLAGEKFAWGKQTEQAISSGGTERAAMQDYDARNLRFVPIRGLAQQIADSNGATLSYTARIDAPEFLTNSKGHVFLSLPKDASPALMSESLAAASYAKMSIDDPILEQAARKATSSGTSIGFRANIGEGTATTREPLHAAFEGARAYIRGDHNNFNEFSDALTDRFGAVEDQDRFVLNEMVNNRDSTLSVWNRNNVPEISNGIPIGADTRGAMQNPAIEAMNPARRKDAIFAALSYTHDQAMQRLAGESPVVFKLAHGETARALSSDEVNQALAMYQIAGARDFESSLSSSFMKAGNALAQDTGKDFSTAYQALSTAAPHVASRIGLLPREYDLSSISSLGDLASTIMPAKGQTAAEAMQGVLTTTGQYLALMDAHNIPLTEISNKVAPEIFSALSGVAPAGLDSPSGKNALAIIARNLSSPGIPHTAETMEATYAYVQNGGRVEGLDSLRTNLATQAYTDRGATGVNPHVIEVAAHQGYGLAPDKAIPWADLEKTAMHYQTGQVSDYRLAGFVSQLADNNIPVNRNTIALAVESSNAFGEINGDHVKALIRVSEAVKYTASAPIVLDTFARAQAQAQGINTNQMNIGQVFHELEKLDGRNSPSALAKQIVDLSRNAGRLSDHQLQDPLTVQMLLDQGASHPYAPKAINVVTNLVGSTEAANNPRYIPAIQELLNNGSKMRDIMMQELNAAVALAEARAQGALNAQASEWNNVRLSPQVLKMIQQDPSYSILDNKLSETLIDKILRAANRF